MRILRFKHWQIFIMLTSLILLSVLISSFDFNIGLINSFQLSIIIRELGMIVFFLWLLILGLTLNKLKNNPFKFNSFIFALSILLCIIGYSNLNLNVFMPNNYEMPLILNILMVLFTYFGYVYVFYTLPKSLKSLEAKRKVPFTDFVIDILLILFFPIGIWFVQPRLNKLLE